MINIKKIVYLVIALLIIIFLIYIINSKEKENKIILENIAEVETNETIELYSILKDIECGGDLKFNIELDKGEVLIQNLDRIDL